MLTRVLVEKGEKSPSFASDDRIFLGEGLFETLKVQSGRACFADLHWHRLSAAANDLCIPFDLSLDDWLVHLQDQIKRDNLYHGGIKAILSGGSAPRGLVQQGQVSHLMLQTFNYVIHTQPVRLKSAVWLRDGTNPIYQVKSVNYLEAILARRQALASGADDALFFNTQHHATETTCANLFIMNNNELYTPPIRDGVLPGVTRSRLFTLCEQQQIFCKELSLTQSMIAEADAVFITNSLQGIRIVQSLDDLVFHCDYEPLKQLMALLGLLL